MLQRSGKQGRTRLGVLGCFGLLTPAFSPSSSSSRENEVSSYCGAECNSRGLRGSFFPGSSCMCSQARPANCYWWWWRGGSPSDLGSGSPCRGTKRWALLTLIVAAAEQQRLAYNWREHWASKKTLQRRSMLILSCAEGRRHCSVLM